MRKLFVAAQWIVVLAFVSTAVYLAVRPEPAPEHNPADWTSWRGFTAISYLGVTREGDSRYVSESRLEEHLQALRDAGYLTITPDDAAAFLAARAPLPDKALLVMFEGGRKDSFLRATPVLRRTAQLATLCLPTDVVGRFGAFHLDKRDLRRISALPHWSLCSMGHEALHPVPVNAQGSTGHFLTRHKWLDGRAETADEFRRRIERDYDAAARLLEAVNDGPVAAYAYPYSDWAATPDSESAAADLNRQAVAAHHRLAFTSTGSAFNGFGADPYNLSRVRVAGDWDASRLLEELQSFAPRETAVEAVTAPGVWILSGGALLDGERVRMPPAAVAWVRGSDGWTDTDSTANLALDSEQAIAALYARHHGPASYLRVVLTAGSVQVQERVAGEARTLAQLATETRPGAARVLRLRVKGHRAWAWLDGELVGGPLPVAVSTRLGRTGFGSQREAVTLAGFTARPIPADFVLADSYDAIGAAQREAAVAILSPWFGAGPVAPPGAARERDVLLAAAAGVETIPMVPAVPPAQARDYAAAVAQALHGPVLSRLVTRLAVQGAGSELVDALRGHGYRIIRHLQPAEATRLAATDGMASGDLLLLDGPARELNAALEELLHRVPASHIIAVTTPDTSLPSWTRRAVRVDGAQPQ